MIRIQPLPPFIEIGGARYPVEWRVAKLFEILLSARRQVRYDTLLQALDAPQKSLHSYVWRLREVIEEFDYFIVTEPDIGLTLVKRDKAEIPFEIHTANSHE